MEEFRRRNIYAELEIGHKELPIRLVLSYQTVYS